MTNDNDDFKMESVYIQDNVYIYDAIINVYLCKPGTKNSKLRTKNGNCCFGIIVLFAHCRGQKQPQCQYLVARIIEYFSKYSVLCKQMEYLPCIWLFAHLNHIATGVIVYGTLDWVIFGFPVLNIFRPIS